MLITTEIIKSYDFIFFFFLTKGVDVLFFRFPFLKQIKHKSWYKGE